jgi:integrase
VGRFVTARRHEPTARNGHPNTRKTLAGASAKTVAEEVNLIASVMRFAAERKLIQVSPDLTMMQRELASHGVERDVARPLSPEEAKRLLAAAKRYDADEPTGYWAYPNYFFAMLSTFLYTGLRHDELRHLRWADVDLSEGLIQIRHKKFDVRRTIAINAAARTILDGLLNDRQAADRVCRNDADIQRLGRALGFKEPDALAQLAVRQVDLAAGVVRIEERMEWQPKGVEGKVLIHPELSKILVPMKAVATSDFLFPHPDGGPWRFHLNHKLHEISDMAKLPEKPRVHDLRHTVGATLRRAGVGLETIQGVLRHSCLEDTLRYAKYEINEGRTAIQKLPNWSG